MAHDAWHVPRAPSNRGVGRSCSSPFGSGCFGCRCNRCSEVSSRLSFCPSSQLLLVAHRRPPRKFARTEGAVRNKAATRRPRRRKNRQIRATGWQNVWWPRRPDGKGELTKAPRESGARRIMRGPLEASASPGVTVDGGGCTTAPSSGAGTMIELEIGRDGGS